MSKAIQALGVVPARFAASRFPGKAVTRIAGKTVVEHAFRNLSEAPGIARVVVATDDERVVEAVRAFGGEAFLSLSRHATGTDRSAEVARDAAEALVVNLQIDQPFLSPQAIGDALAALAASPDASMSTLVRRTTYAAAAADPDGVTTVLGRGGRCLYFSRAVLPSRGFTAADAAEPWVWQHVGLYCYRKTFLFQLARTPRSDLEQSEGLEQLRAYALDGEILGVPMEGPAFFFHRPEEMPAAEAFVARDRVPAPKQAAT